MVDSTARLIDGSLPGPSDRAARLCLGLNEGNALSGSLRPTEIRRRRHRKEKRQKRQAKLAKRAAHERATPEAKLQKIGGLPKK
jgi:hypothetical protein